MCQSSSLIMIMVLINFLLNQILTFADREEKWGQQKADLLLMHTDSGGGGSPKQLKQTALLLDALRFLQKSFRENINKLSKSKSGQFQNISEG